MKNLNILVYLAIILFTRTGPAAAGPIENWRTFEVAVRDGNIPKKEAALKLAALVPGLSSYAEDVTLSGSTWAFPLEGYESRAVSKQDFKPGTVYGPYGTKGYDFFDGNRHGGHPAHDIFIHDRNRNCLDDGTGLQVKAVAMEDCVVLSVNTGWKKGGLLRGGNYVWLYNPKDNKFFYYAHLNEIYVKAGDKLKAGQALGTVGRSGRLARLKTSPTHVHLMVLEYKGGKLLLFDYYDKIKTSRIGELAN